jgi:GrpB-like predicted nucleotidyltransferase (UPF0157 family)
MPVLLAPYNSVWAEMATDHAARLQTLGATLVAVHHIGSTSVPGLAAKPIIDLMALVINIDDLDRKRALVEELGWSWHGELGITGRRYCTLSDDKGVRIAQLHIFAADSPHVVRHLAFRDYLRANRGVAGAYEEEKRRARDLHPGDSHAYADEKSAWIRRIEADALAWFEQRRNNQNS